MKKLTLFTATLFCVLLFSMNGHAQKTKLVSGDLNFLKGVKELKIEYVYDGMMIGSKTEEEYTDSKVKEKNKKEPGSGDTWLTSWNRDKEARFQPKFEELFNEKMEKKGIKADTKADDAKYTMIVKTTRLEPGFNIGITRQNAEIDVEISFVETSNPSNVLCKITVKKSPGQIYGGMDFDTGTRIAEAYAKCGKVLGAFLVKKFPK